MEKTIRFVHTWEGLKANVKQVCKHCHVFQMSKISSRKKLARYLKRKEKLLSGVGVELHFPFIALVVLLAFCL